MNDQLSLNLSMRSIPSPDVVAIVGYFSVVQRSSALAVFLRDGGCIDLPCASQDAQAVEVWTSTQLAEQFLRLSPCHCFNVANIASTQVDDDAIAITMDGIELPFLIPATSSAKEALFAWAGYGIDETQPRQAILA